MPSPALTAWSTISAAALSQLEAAHRAVGGTRSDATQLLVDAIDPGIAVVLDTNLTFARQLDRGNAQPSALGADFNRLDLEFWTVVKGADARNAARQRKLDELNDWRNAIAHHDIESNRSGLHPREVTLDTCRSWRGALNGLAESFDRVLAGHLATLLGSRPW